MTSLLVPSVFSDSPMRQQFPNSGQHFSAVPHLASRLRSLCLYNTISLGRRIHSHERAKRQVYRQRCQLRHRPKSDKSCKVSMVKFGHGTRPLAMRLLLGIQIRTMPPAVLQAATSVDLLPWRDVGLPRNGRILGGVKPYGRRGRVESASAGPSCSPSQQA